jgi:hypothetical protein
MKLLEVNRKEIGMGKVILDKKTKAQETIAKIDKWDYIKLKASA